MTLFSSPGLKKTGSFCLFPSWTSHLEPSCHTVRKVRASLTAQPVKNLSAMQETQVWSLGQEDPLEKEMTTHASILVWKIPWTEEPGGLLSKGLQRVRRDWATKHTSMRKMQQPVRESTGKEQSPYAPTWWPAPVPIKWDYFWPSNHLSSLANTSWSSITIRSTHRNVRNHKCFKIPNLGVVCYLAIAVFFPKFYYENI